MKRAMKRMPVPAAATVAILGLLSALLTACTRPAAGQIALDSVDVVQSVYAPGLPMPLITGKDTYVLAYARTGSGTAPVAGTLTMAGFPPLLPINGPSVYATTAGYEPWSLDHALIFELSRDMTAAGTRSVTVNLQMPSGYTAPTEQGQVRDHTTFDMTFGPQNAPSITIYGWRYGYNGLPTDVQSRYGLPTSDFPPQPRDELEQYAKLAQNVLPVASISVDWSLDDNPPSIECRGDGNGGCGAYEDARYDAGIAMDQRFPEGGHAMVVLQPELPSVSGGHGFTCTTPRGNHRINIIDHTGSDAGFVLAHELGHSLGLWHTPEVDASPRPPTDDALDPGFQRLNGAMGPFIGLRIGAPGHLPQLMLGENHPAGTVAHYDLMSYSFPQWISPFSYCVAMRTATNHQWTCPASLDGNGRFSDTLVQQMLNAGCAVPIS